MAHDTDARETTATGPLLHAQIVDAVRRRGVPIEDTQAGLEANTAKLWEELDEFSAAALAGNLWAARLELADIYVVVARAERLLESLTGQPFDVAQEALAKARRDIDRPFIR
jgi:hypothetical protein